MITIINNVFKSFFSFFFPSIFRFLLGGGGGGGQTRFQVSVSANRRFDVNE